jgi:polysaccharide biosynthesis transport protein
LLPMHPRIKALTAQLASLDEQVRGAAAKNVRGLEDEARIAGDQVASLNAALAEQSRIVATGKADDAQLRALDLEAKTVRERLESFLQKNRECAFAPSSRPGGPRPQQPFRSRAPLEAAAIA